ncbi:hypothetical protein CC2G_009782 [Coprinopsis cinerea AmutBmut pab1-1]|nr:hypothetical protein CC2G_009782 [Coprinopsis cinerea AmutBmut pab1-1]
MPPPALRNTSNSSRRFSLLEFPDMFAHMLKRRPYIDNPLMLHFPRTEDAAVKKFAFLVNQLDPELRKPGLNDPPDAHRRWDVKIQNAYWAIIGISLIMMWASSPEISSEDAIPVVKHRISLILIDNLELVLAWVRQLLREKRVDLPTIISFLAIVMVSKGDLVVAVLNSPCAVECAILLLTSEGPQSGLFTPETWWSIAGTVLTHQAARRNLFEQLKKLPTSVVKTYIGNTLSALDGIQTNIDNARAGYAARKSICDGIARMGAALEFLLCDPDLARHLLSQDYHRRFVKVATNAHRIVTDPFHRRLLADSIALTFLLSGYHPRHTPKIVVDLLQMDTLPVLLDGLQISSTAQEAQNIKNSLMHITYHMNYRRVYVAVNEAWNAIPDSAMAWVQEKFRGNPLDLTPGAHAWFVFFLFGPQLRQEVLLKSCVGDPSPCQNLHHLAIGESGQFKVCSRCRSVTYCDAKCQSDDWERVHKYECRNLRYDHDQLVGQNRWVSHHMRRVLLLCMQRHLDSVGDSEFVREAMDTLVAIYGTDALKTKPGIFASTRFDGSNQNPEKWVAIERYRRRAETWSSWSPVRFESLVAETRANDDLFLFVYTFSSGIVGPKYHFLVLVDTSNPTRVSQASYPSRFRYGMLQMEHRPRQLIWSEECEEECCR